VNRVKTGEPKQSPLFSRQIPTPIRFRFKTLKIIILNYIKNLRINTNMSRDPRKPLNKIHKFRCSGLDLLGTACTPRPIVLNHNELGAEILGQETRNIGISRKLSHDWFGDLQLPKSLRKYRVENCVHNPRWTLYLKPQKLNLFLWNKMDSRWF